MKETLLSASKMWKSCNFLWRNRETLFNRCPNNFKIVVCQRSNDPKHPITNWSNPKQARATQNEQEWYGNKDKWLQKVEPLNLRCRKVALLLKRGICLRVIISLFMLIKCYCVQRNSLGTRLKNYLANLSFIKANVPIKRIDKKHVFNKNMTSMTSSFSGNIQASTNGGVFLV